MRLEPRKAIASSISPTGRRRRDDLPLELAFLQDWISERAHLHDIARLARHQDVCPARALVAAGVVGEARYYRALARHLGLPYVDKWPVLADVREPRTMADAGRIRIAGDPPWLVAPEGAALRLLLDARRLGRPMPSIAITSPSHLRGIVRLRCDLAIAYGASDALPDATPALSARRTANWRARGVMAIVPLLAIVSIVAPLRLAADLFGALFFTSIMLRLMICAAGIEQVVEPTTRMADADLPVYSVLVPVRHEAGVIADLVAALTRLDYPRAKLEILFLVEPEDVATRDALAASRLPPWCHIVIGPRDDAALRTKPRALNYGLALARGDVVTVYDAEDEPDPSQLRQAAAAFHAADRHGAGTLACLQARLTIVNGGRGWLPRLFAIEYAALFDLFNIGTTRYGLPLALGGTSNHFRTKILRAVGGWDAWNVTEDADLGLRLARLGYRIGNLGSTTREEAPERLGAWLRQRRRWTKGWMQTLLVLACDIRTARRQYGTVRTLYVALMLTNLVTGPLLLPVFGAAVTYHLATTGWPTPGGATSFVESTLAGVVLALGIVGTLLTGWLGLRIRGLGAFAASLPLMLPYQLLISLAAWMGLFDLLVRPFHWHKTTHGREARREPRRSGSMTRTYATRSVSIFASTACRCSCSRATRPP